MPIRESYGQELEQLSNDFIRMGAMAIASADKAFAALDTGDRELASTVLKSPGEINELDTGIQRLGLRLLLRQQPVAKGLRQIMAVTQMTADLERVNDAAVRIAQLSLEIQPELPPTLQDMRKMAAAAREMVVDSVKAYVGESMVLAEYVIRRNEIVEGYFESLRTELVLYAGKGPAEADKAMQYLLVTRYIARLAHHAMSVCEWVKFYKTGIYKNEQIV